MHDAGRLTFRVRTAGSGDRTYPHAVGPRRLPDTLLEYAVGGGWRVRDLDAGTELVVPSGRVVVVPAERRHAMAMVRGRPMRSHWTMLALEDATGRDVLARLPAGFVLPASVSAGVRRLLRALARGPGAGLAASVAYHRRGLQLLGTVVRHGPATGEPAAPSSPRIDAVLRHMNDHLHRPLPRRVLAAVAHLSPTRFHYVFVRATGQSPVQYLTGQRVRRARQLLLSTDLSCKDIGARCGFTSAAHFSRVFTRQTSLGPSAYRRNASPGGAARDGLRSPAGNAMLTGA